MAQPADTTAATDLAALEALADSVESGAGLPDVVRAAARALDASLVVLDRAGNVRAVAARPPNEEQAILAGGSGIEVVELRLGGEPIGELRARLRGEGGAGLARIGAGGSARGRPGCERGRGRAGGRLAPGVGRGGRRLRRGAARRGAGWAGGDAC